jgi:RimJ/RimL family protein N-acetyltransferase
VEDLVLAVGLSQAETAIALTVREDTGVDVPAIRSDRLDLVSLSPAVIEAVFDGRPEEAERQLGFRVPGGFPDDDLEGLLRLRLGQMQSAPHSQQWLVRALVLREEGTMVGHAGFHGQPGTTGLDPGKAEIGYTVFKPFRGRGYATEAAVALMDWAEEEGIHQFVFSIGPWNAPSLAIARKLGFTQTGEQWDEEDGLELVFELDRGATSAG